MNRLSQWIARLSWKQALPLCLANGLVMGAAICVAAKIDTRVAIALDLLLAVWLGYSFAMWRASVTRLRDLEKHSAELASMHALVDVTLLGLRTELHQLHDQHLRELFGVAKTPDQTELN